MAEIDSLDIKIQADSKGAADAIEDLNKKLGIVFESLSAFGKIPGISAASEQFKNMAQGAVAAGERIKAVTKQMEPQAQKAFRTMEEVAQKFKDIGKGFRISGGSSASIQKQIDSYRNALENARVKEQELSAKGKTGTKGYEDAVADIQKYSNMIESLTAQLQEMQSVSQNMDEVPVHLMSDDNRQSMEELMGSLERFRDMLEPGSEYKPFAEVQHSLEELRERFPEAAEWVRAFEDSIAQIESMRPFENVWEGAEIPPELKSAADSTATSIQAAREKTEGFQRLLGQLVVPQVRDGNINRLYSSLAKTEDRLEQLRAKLENGTSIGKIAEDVDDTGFRNLQEQIALTERQAEALREKIAEVGSQFEEEDEVDRFADSLSKLSDAGEKARKALSGIGAAARKIGSAFAGAASRIARLAKSMFGLKDSSDGAHKSFSLGFGKLLKYAFGIRSLYTAMNRLRGAFKDGMDNLVQYSAETNFAVSSLKSSLDALKNALAVAFAPIVNVIAPYISAFIDMLTRAFNVVGQFFAALTGRSFAVQAVRNFSDYAAGVSGAGNAARKAARDVKSALRPFDELKTIALQKDTESGGGGGGGVSVGDMFETVPIEGSVMGVFDRLRELVESRDWEGLGAYIADAANRGLQRVYDAISWDNVGPRVTAFADAFTRTFNSLVDGFDWGLLGRTVGAGVDTIVNTLNLFVDGIDWSNIGTKLSVGMRGMANEVDWGGLGHLLGAKFMIQWDIFTGFVDDMWRRDGLTGLTGWEELGISLGNAVNGLFERIDFGEIAHALASGFNGAIQTLRNFIATVGWGDIADNITNGLNTMIHETDWAEAGAVLGNAVLELLGVFGQVARDTDWVGLGRGIGHFLENIPWGEILGTTFGIIWDVLSGLISGLLDTEGGRVVLGIGAGVLAIAAFFNPAGALITAIATAAGLIIANWDDISASVDELKANIEEKFEGIKESITGTTTELRRHVPEDFENIQSGLDRTMRSSRQNIDTELAGIRGGFTRNMDDMHRSSVNTFSSMDRRIAENLSNIETNTENTMGAVSRKVAETGSSMNAANATAWNSMQATIGNAGNGIRSSVSRATADISSSMSNAWNMVRSNTDSSWSTAGQRVRGSLNTMRMDMSAATGSMTSSLSSACGRMQSLTSGAWGSIEGRTASAWNGIGSTISRTMATASGTVRSEIGRMRSAFDFTWSLPHLSLPHISINGGFNLNPPSAPVFDVQWYAKGGLFGSASVIGIGEKGPEAVLPLTDTRAMGTIAESIFENYNADIAHPDNDGPFGMSEAAMYNLIYNAVSAAINNNPLLRDVRQYAKDGHVIEADGREIAETVRREASNYWHATGGKSYFPI